VLFQEKTSIVTFHLLIFFQVYFWTTCCIDVELSSSVLSFFKSIPDNNYGYLSMLKYQQYLILCCFSTKAGAYVVFCFPHLLSVLVLMEPYALVNLCTGYSYNNAHPLSDLSIHFPVVWFLSFQTV